MIYNTLDVAQLVIDYYEKNRIYITNLGLQKILFFIQWHFLTSYDKPCFKDKIEAWPYGPVVPCVYEKCKIFGANQIIPSNISGDSTQISLEDKQLIEKQVLDKLKKYKEYQLVDKTHQKGGSWDKTDQYYQEISLKDIKNDTTINFDEINVEKIINKINFNGILKMNKNKYEYSIMLESNGAIGVLNYKSEYSTLEELVNKLKYHAVKNVSYITDNVYIKDAKSVVAIIKIEEHQVDNVSLDNNNELISSLKDAVKLLEDQGKEQEVEQVKNEEIEGFKI